MQFLQSSTELKPISTPQAQVNQRILLPDLVGYIIRKVMSVAVQLGC